MASGTFLPPGIRQPGSKISSGGTDNYVMTAVDSENIQGEANLTFDGSTLTVTADVTIQGTTPTLTIGDAGTEDAAIVFDGNAVDYHIGLDDNHDALTIGSGSSLDVAGATSIVDFYKTGKYIWQTQFKGSFTSNGAGTYAGGLAVGIDVTAANGDTGGHSVVFMGKIAGASLTTQDNSETIGLASTLYVNEPAITKGASDTITEAATVIINDAPTEGASNYALFVNAGVSRFDGTVLMGTTTTTGWSTSADDLIVGDGSNPEGLTIYTGTDTYGSIFFCDDGSESSPKGYIQYGHGGAGERLIFGTGANTGMILAGGATPILTLYGTAGAGGDAMVFFDGEAEDYHIGLDDSSDDLVLGKGSTLGTTPYITLDGGNWGGAGGVYLGSPTNLTGTSWFGMEMPALTASVDTDFYRMRIRTGSAVTTAGSGSDHDVIATLMLNEPNITIGTADVTNSAVIYIYNAATEATNDYAIFVNDGVSRFDGGTIIGAATSTNNLVDDASNGSGTTTLYVGNASITVSSDERLKTDIRPTAINALSLVDEFKVVDFGWDDPTDTAEYDKNYRGRYTGMIAQDTVKIAPWIINDQGGGKNCNQCMTGNECEDHGMWQVEYQHLVPTLVKAIQELNAKLEAQTAAT